MNRNLVFRFAVVALAAVLAITGAACSTTQPVETQVDDAGIHAAVKAKLTADRFSNITNIDVNVTNGIVTLAGEVPNAQVRTEAGREAASVEGVKKVNNNLMVKSPATP
jgi:osmotically-inducible protein OsmY